MRRIVVLSAAAVAVALLVLAYQLRSGDAAPQRTAVGFRGGPVLSVRAVASDLQNGGSVATRSRTFAHIPGVSGGGFVRVFIPRRSFLLIRFSSSAWCQSRALNQYCSVIVLVNHKEAYPRAGANARFGASGGEGAESHAFDRLIGPLGRGLYTVMPMWSVSNRSTEFRMFTWTLAVENVRI
jgi:hypothetical protein